MLNSTSSSQLPARAGASYRPVSVVRAAHTHTSHLLLKRTTRVRQQLASLAFENFKASRSGGACSELMLSSCESRANLPPRHTTRLQFVPGSARRVPFAVSLLYTAPVSSAAHCGRHQAPFNNAPTRATSVCLCVCASLQDELDARCQDGGRSPGVSQAPSELMHQLAELDNNQANTATTTTDSAAVRALARVLCRCCLAVDLLIIARCSLAARPVSLWAPSRRRRRLRRLTTRMKLASSLQFRHGPSASWARDQRVARLAAPGRRRADSRARWWRMEKSERKQRMTSRAMCRRSNETLTKRARARERAQLWN